MTSAVLDLESLSENVRHREGVSDDRALEDHGLLNVEHEETDEWHSVLNRLRGPVEERFLVEDYSLVAGSEGREFSDRPQPLNRALSGRGAWSSWSA